MQAPTSRRRLVRSILVSFGPLAALFGSTGTLSAWAQWIEPDSDTPAHFAKAPRAGGPPILSGPALHGRYFTQPYQITIYKMAAHIAPVLFEQPCFCRCDLALRHKSLHSCFEGLHGAVCATCMRSAMYAYQQTRQGKPAAEVRAGLERGEWQRLRLEDATL